MEAKYTRGEKVTVSIGSGHSIVLSDKWRGVPAPLAAAVMDTPGVDTREGKAAARTKAAPKVAKASVSERTASSEDIV